MKKSDAEPLIRSLCHAWKAECFPAASEQDLSFSDFARWARERHPMLFEFRSTMGAMHDAQHWFDQEFRQTWRN